MEWILHSEIVGLYLSEKDPASNPSGMTRESVCVCVSVCENIRVRTGSHRSFV